MTNNLFLHMIESLRKKEEIILYENRVNLDQKEFIDVLKFLKKEYQAETLNYPFQAPLFDEQAALWAAKTVYTSAQLILYRENKEADLVLLLPNFKPEITPSSILSADLCLRFLADMIKQLKLIDPEDELIPLLEKKLLHWHYSGINYPLDIEQLDFKNISINPCLKQLYINRIIFHKKVQLAKHPACQELVLASLGMYKNEFWKNLEITIANE